MVGAPAWGCVGCLFLGWGLPLNLQALVAGGLRFGGGYRLWFEL